METIRRSYHIFRQSLAVLSKDKEILIFPLLSGIVTIIAFSTMVFAGLTSGLFQNLAAGDRSLAGNFLGYVMLFVWYFVSWFIVIYFNVAVIHCAKMRLDGGDPTVADGFRAASQHLPRIVAWAAISATVGIILKVLAERGKVVGRIVSSIVGAAWSIATYFIVPVMIFENRSLKDSVAQSTELIRKTWGESLVAVAGIGAFTMLLAVPAIFLPVIGILISPGALIALTILMVAYWIALAVVTSALGSIFRTSLYLYAAQGRAPEGFTPEYVQHAFAPKGAKGMMRFGTA